MPKMKNNAFSQFMKIFGLRGRCWLCKKLCGDRFFNRDASREIDRLLLELEKIRAGGIS